MNPKLRSRPKPDVILSSNAGAGTPDGVVNPMRIEAVIVFRYGRNVLLVQVSKVAKILVTQRSRAGISSPAPRNLVSDCAGGAHQPFMQGFEHVEDVIIRFIPALFDSFGDEFVQGRFLQLPFPEEVFK
ncbi:hypothetical protein [Bradyrhizobium iriomotense]|uniref:hypothetical protein n=1 Tax=Bradyrhizobium iriomotense TaxID=441950 RepID=UPI0024E17D68|nr:hypothetical protein [Bradyrhizobium iriomotense]